MYAFLWAVWHETGLEEVHQRAQYIVKFLHKDELHVQYPDIKTTLPAVVRLQNNTSKTLLNGKDFKSIQSLDELKSAVMKALEE